MVLNFSQQTELCYYDGFGCRFCSILLSEVPSVPNLCYALWDATQLYKSMFLEVLLPLFPLFPVFPRIKQWSSKVDHCSARPNNQAKEGNAVSSTAESGGKSGGNFPIIPKNEKDLATDNR